MNLFSFLPQIISLSLIMAPFCQIASCGRILLIPAPIGHNSASGLRDLGDALAEREHEVLLWYPASRPLEADQTSTSNTSTAKIESFQVTVSDEELSNIFGDSDQKTKKSIFPSNWNENGFIHNIQAMGIVNKVSNLYCQSILTDHEGRIRMLLKQDWDLTIIDDNLNPCGLAVAHITKAPFILYSGAFLRSGSGFSLGSPWPLAYSPSSHSLFSDNMSIFQRLTSTVQNVIAQIIEFSQNFLFTDHFENALQKFTSEKFSFTKIRRGAALMFVDFPKELEFPGPSLSKIVHLGGLTCKKEWKDVSKIESDLMEKIFAAKNGVILVSFGDEITWADAPKENVEAFVEALNRLKDHLVIWQIDIDRPTGLKDHVITMDRVPQPQLLHLQKTVLFVSHGGAQSIKEGICAQIPIVGIPFSGDNFGNLMRLEAKDAAFILPKSDTGSPESIVRALKEVLRSKKYSAGIKLLKKLIDQDPIDSMERAVFWSEHVIRNHGAEEYSTEPLEELSMIAYYAIDYWVVLIFGLIISLKFAKDVVSQMLRFLIDSEDKEEKLKIQ